MVSRLARCLAVVALAAVAGCGPHDADRVEVRGRVSLRGVPLTGGAVVFTPDVERGTPDEMAVARIHSDGTYRLLTEDGRDLAPGWYRVSISGPRAAKGLPALTVPDRYCDPRRSGIERKVKAGQSNIFDFDLD